MNEVLRQEKKFLIGLPDYYYHSGNLAKFMLEDSHTGGTAIPSAPSTSTPWTTGIFRRSWTACPSGEKSGSGATARTAPSPCWR